MKRIIYIPFDHLHPKYGALRDANPKSDLIVLVESARMVNKQEWNKIRLYFLIASARHFADELTTLGYTVKYLKAENTILGLKQIKNEFPNLPIICAEPSSHLQSKQLKDFGVTFVENDFFLTPRKLFNTWAVNQKSFLMENFYRAQRARLGVLVEGGKPVGGKWNFDKENRLPPPKNYKYPPYLIHKADQIDIEVADELGITPVQSWGTTRKAAKAQLKNFIDNHFKNFGPYEDAMTGENWALHHSLLSPYINNGLLHPAEVLTAAVSAYKKGVVDVASAEGFIRQIIGWREYVNGMYWYLGASYKKSNHLNANRKLLPLFTDPSKTKMVCVKTTVSDIQVRGWVHHIPRLMILSNLALITGTNPQQFLDWMRREFIDASDWVMVPNVIGMGLHADNGQMMSKPYAAGGAYISRMSTYCKGCAYDPRLRVGDNACPFTTLYWDFLHRHKDEFVKNHRMSQQVYGLKRLSDLKELKERAKVVLTGLDKGVI
jgi:deoxyribodipyrimidine photolyase-related protein